MYLLELWIEHSTLKLDRLFTYLADCQVLKGARVSVNFNNRNLIGFCESCTYTLDSLEELEVKMGYSLKKINYVVDELPILNEELYNLGKRMARDTLSPTIACFQAMLPSYIKPKTTVKKAKEEKWVRVNKYNGIQLTDKQFEVYQQMVEAKDMTYHDYRLVYKTVGKTLIEKGLVTVYQKEKEYRRKDIKERAHKVLNQDQTNAYNDILKTDKLVSLLHGITGSGKTEVYLKLTSHYIEQGKQVIILVPEISLTSMMIDRCQAYFGDDVAIYHSGLNNQEKYEQYKRVLRKEVKVVVGTRSAIFMPFDNIGLIVIDEQHDLSYKQDSVPCYNTLDIAVLRAEYHHAKVLMASATPNLESYARAIKGVYQLVKLTKRYTSDLPEITIVDMNKAIRNNENYIISNELKKALIDTVNNNEQAIVLLNRRGYTNTLRCENCNEMLMCSHCDMTLSYHYDIKALMCHHCGSVYPLVNVCPSCHKPTKFLHLGYGTQKVQEVIEQTIPNAKVLRMDRDTTTRKNAHKNILDAFANKEYNILLGTQMIAKGLDYPDVSLVGIINGDEGLKRSDYRSAEICFDLIVQASGRSGRKKEGKVILQAFNVDHYALQCALKHDYENFFVHEMKYRHLIDYPPYSYLIALYVNDLSEKKTLTTINLIYQELNGDFKILGPTKLLKLKDEYRYRLLIKGKNLNAMISVLNNILNKVRKGNNLANIKVDVNPMVI